MQPRLDHRPHRRPDIVSQLLQAEAVLVLPAKAEVKVLNPVGARIWSLVDGRRTVRDIAMLIHTEYNVDQAEAEADTLHFVAELAQREMVDLH